MSFQTLKEKSLSNIEQYYKNKYKPRIFPNKDVVFRAFDFVQPKDVKVVILGQDPYPLYGYANGLAFAVDLDKWQKYPPSLLYIFQGLDKEYGPFWDSDCTLESWAKQGVLLLNSSLTVEEKKPGSHSQLWREFTEYVIGKISETKSNIVFMLWGSEACSFENCIKNKENHLVIRTGHPAVMKNKFIGGFRECNDYLIDREIKQIDW
jgi:uracil-DNA glycosylase